MSKMTLKTTEPTNETSDNSTLAKLPNQPPQFSGDWDYGDTRIPRLNLVHKTSDGEMIERFGIGAFCFNKEIKLSDGKTPLLVTALRAAKDFIQKLPFGDPEMPLVFKTKDEVLANGGSFNKKDAANRSYYIPRAHIQFIVRMPKDADEESAAMFPYEHDGHQYGMAVLTVSSSAYTATAIELATLCAHNSVMRQGMPYGKLELTSSARTSPRYSWLVPQIQFAGANKEDFIKFVEGLM